MKKNSPSAKKPSRKPHRKNGRSERRSRLWKLFIRVFAIGFVLLACWMVYLDAVVTSRFEGRRFEVPSQMYARPLELYDGAGVSSGSLERELALAGYRKGDGVKPGSYRRNGGHFIISTRGFRFPDGSEPRRTLSLNIYGDRVQDFSVSAGENAPIVRLEPARIGGIYPAHKEDRILVRLDEVPAQLPAALMAVEDRNFYDHIG